MKDLEQKAREAYEHRRRDYGSVNENAIHFAASFARQQVEARDRQVMDRLIKILNGDATLSGFIAELRGEGEEWYA